MDFITLVVLYVLTIQRILSDYFYFVDDIHPDDFTPPKTGLRRFVNEEYKLSTDMDCVIREWVFWLLVYVENRYHNDC